MKNKLAIIDMGTNTFHLLIAEAEGSAFNIIYRDRLAVKIGMGGINDGIITEDGIHRALVAMQSFRNTMLEHHVDNVYAFGTSAMRNARNRADVVARIKQLTSIDVNVISGDQEAEFIYEGVRAALGLGHETSLIIDIGGGSVEFIIGNQDEIFWKKSFEIGAQRLLEMFHRHDPILQEELDALEHYFNRTLTDAFVHIEKFRPTILVGSSGTFDTLSDIFCIEHDIHKSPEEVETPLTIQGFYEIFNLIVSRNRAERMEIPGMIDMRVDMIVVASSLIRFLLEKFHFNRIRVSTYSLKEGVLAHFSRKL